MYRFFEKKRDLFISVFVFITLIILNYTAGRTVSDVMASQRNIPITCVEREDSLVALTYNLSSSSNLDFILSKVGANKLTFFVSRDYLRENSAAVTRLIAQGHTIGLLEGQLKNTQRSEIYDLTAKRIKEAAEIIGTSCKIIRIENNLYDADSINALYGMGLYPIQWSTDSYADDFSSGDIILITESCDFEKLFFNIEKNGCKTTTVDNLIINNSFYVDVRGKMIAVT